MNCTHVFKSGKRKGKACGKATSEDASFCNQHLPTVAAIPAQYMETLDVLQFKFLTLDTSNENKAVIVKRLRYLETLSASSTEYQKNLNWLREALSFPYNKMIRIPVAEKTCTSAQVSDYVTQVYNKLDNYIYGMQDVKEELMSFVCKRISNPESNDHVLALQGLNGVGKCFAIDTEILMFDGSKKKVQDVVEGDVIMGDDSTPRLVLGLGHGYDDLYKVTHLIGGATYTVNEDHILVLKSDDDDDHQSIQELSVRKYLELPKGDADVLKGYINGVEYSFKETEMDPYLLGAWLGAGSRCGKRFNVQEMIVLTTINEHLLGFRCHLSSAGKHDYDVVQINDKKDTFFFEELKSLNLINNKHIPPSYLVNSKSVRMQLLAGLLDTIGRALETGFEIAETDEILTHDIRELCTSLGLCCIPAENRCLLILGFCEEIPTKCLGETAPTDSCRADHAASQISIEHVGKGEYYGFVLDGNERFLLGNYVVAHNTRLAHGLAKALDLPIRTINLGSVNDVSYFTGHSFTYVDSCPGKIIQILNETKCKNCIIYFDELDKIHKTDKGQAIYAFLTHLIDPSQNTKFQDIYLSGLEFDVSKIFFVFSYNDEESLDKTVKDRLKILRIKNPSHEDKVNIAEKFIVPEICRNINFDVEVRREVIDEIVSLDKNRSGLRGVRRVLEDIICKLNVVRLLDDGFRTKMSYYHHCQDRMIKNIIDKHEVEGDVYESMYC